MEPSSTNTEEARTDRDKEQELFWYYVQPAYKQVRGKDFFNFFLILFACLGVVALIDKELLTESAWVLLLLPLAGIFSVWTVLSFKPHRQIFYRIDAAGVECEYRSTIAPMMARLRLWYSLILGLFGGRDVAYKNQHYSRSRYISWREVISVKVNDTLRCATLQAGLNGKIYLWADEKTFPRVLILVEGFTHKLRRNYD